MCPLQPTSSPTGLRAYHPLITPIGIMRPRSRTGMVDPRRGAIIGSPQPLPGQVAAPTKANRSNPPPLRHPMQLIPGKPPSSRSRSRLPNLERKLQVGHDLPRSAVPANESLRNSSCRMKSVLQKSWLPSLEVMRRGQLRSAQLVLTAKQGCRLKKTHRVENLVGFPTLIFWGNARNYLAINKAGEAGELRMVAHHLGSAREIQLHNVVHNHGIEDRLHYLKDGGVLRVLCSHAKVNTRAEAVMIRKERVRALS
ncbi:hypothetical protein Cgig2_006745 [Carnegiea gigantea]|uniref:Uncharacterized protein n=1 Tax=Carnegiea gigantea TaxID=171969 RepID=A0A9Q1GK11_9CARY|nr:hypothetical protein Cgig2_006745 [Carnegiea gigantea]